MWRGFSCGLVWAVGCKFLISVFLVLLGKQLAVEHIFEYNSKHGTRGTHSNDVGTVQSAG